ATVVVSARPAPDSPDACSNAKPTPIRLATLAAMRTRSATGRELSSRGAIVLGAAASAPWTANQIHAQKTAAAVSQARSTDACQGTTHAAAKPAINPTEP